jgi:NitT/TauT family transport system substrate-binding protein
MKPTKYQHCLIATGIALLALMPKASAEDTLKVAIAQPGAWESSAPQLGQQTGIFKKHGIVLEFLHAHDSEETEQRVISGNAEVGLGVDTMEVLRAYARGAPVRIIGANMTGATSYWYVLTTSPIQTIKDLVGKTIAYAKNGSSSHYDVLDFIEQFRLKARLVSTGGPAATFKELEAHHVDVGWAAPPFGIDAIEQGKIRVLARANDVRKIRGKTVSVLITNADALQRRKDVLERFMEGYRDTIEWMYSDPAALKLYAELAGVSEELARQLRDEYVKKEMLSPDKIAGLRALIKDAKARLSRRQVAELVQIPASVRNGATACPSGRPGCPSLGQIQSP